MREMKDSGISWINEIPGNWNVEPIKYSYRLIAGATPESTNVDFCQLTSLFYLFF